MFIPKVGIFGIIVYFLAIGFAIGAHFGVHGYN
jgi:hypothetical protein